MSGLKERGDSNCPSCRFLLLNDFELLDESVMRYDMNN